VKNDGTHPEPKKHSPKAFGILSGVIKHGWLENPPFIEGTSQACLIKNVPVGPHGSNPQCQLSHEKYKPVIAYPIP